LIAKLLLSKTSIPCLLGVRINSIAILEQSCDFSIGAAHVNGIQDKWRKLAVIFHESHIAETPLGKPRLFLSELWILMIDLHNWDHQNAEGKKQIN